MQHILLKQLKPTIPHVTHPNCVHTHGPHGVKIATQRIREALQEEQPQYLIRADVKSFYRSIVHDKLVADLKKTYDDPKLIRMFEEIIRNPIQTPKGYKNSITGIALRGPLSQLFGAIYLRPLDEAFDAMDVTYIRYMDDIVILCKTKRQLARCRRRLMNILQERKLKLSRKKTRMGPISTGFHFCGIDYPGTQTQDITRVEPAINDDHIPFVTDDNLVRAGGRQLVIIFVLHLFVLNRIRAQYEMHENR